MIDILDHYQRWVPKDSNDNPVPIALYGNGLTCERTKDAVGARVNAQGRWWRLQGLESCIQKWYKQQLRMQVSTVLTPPKMDLPPKNEPLTS